MRTLMNAAQPPQLVAAISESRLRRAGLRPTAVRLQLLDMFEKYRGSPQHAEEIYRLLLRNGFTGGLSSVYTNLRKFVEIGVLEACEPRERKKMCATYMLAE